MAQQVCFALELLPALVAGRQALSLHFVGTILLETWLPATGGRLFELLARWI